MKNIGFMGLTLILAATGAADPAKADPRDEALSALLRCSGMSDKAQRLTCYDSAVVRVPGALNAPSAPAANAAPTAVATKPHSGGFFSRVLGLEGPRRSPQTTAAQFGSESIGNGGSAAYPDAIDGDRIDAITAGLVSYELNGGYMTVTLDDGQIWRQVSGEPVGHLRRPAASYVVTIGRGSAGAYSMKLSHFARALAVRRLR